MTRSGHFHNRAREVLATRDHLGAESQALELIGNYAYLDSEITKDSQ